MGLMLILGPGVYHDGLAVCRALASKLFNAPSPLLNPLTGESEEDPRIPVLGA